MLCLGQGGEPTRPVPLGSGQMVVISLAWGTRHDVGGVGSHLMVMGTLVHL